MKKIAILSGAGMSAESGIRTFRDADGLWEQHDVMEVASIDGWRRNPELVLRFYNQRRRQLQEVEPNAGHIALKRLESAYDVHIVTQNVDDLHERAGSSNILHLHGELRKVRSVGQPALVYEWLEDLQLGDLCESGHQLRPHIVWFGEMVPLMDKAVEILTNADIVIIIGTSMQVYPAAGLIAYARPNASIYYIDPQPSINYELSDRRHLEVISDRAAAAVPALVDRLLAEAGV
ncbi:MAG: NAD-dependent deacylase [Saprospiraceae bacterium]|nr:NAD-dependent deacylase [Saprospiraceae bacterium]